MRSEEQERARQQLIDAVKEWREVECSYASSSGKSDAEGEFCDGDNHLIGCPVEAARQDILAAHNKVEQLRAG